MGLIVAGQRQDGCCSDLEVKVGGLYMRRGVTGVFFGSYVASRCKGACRGSYADRLSNLTPQTSSPNLMQCHVEAQGG